MHERHLYEYAVIRVVPRVEREEFVNVGIIVFCKKTGYLGVRYNLSADKIQALDPLADVECIAGSLASFELISRGDAAGGPIATLDTPGRFRWLTATRSTILQTSKVHPGLSINPQETLDILFERLVR